MVHCNGKVVASKDEMSCFVQGICDCQCFPFNWCITGFSSMCESASN